MPAWPRTIVPQRSTPFRMPGALANWGQSGKGQHRATTQIGRIWTETFPAFQANGIAGRELLATINDYWRNGTAFTIDHRLYLARLGTGGLGTPRVNGASQTGSVLQTDGWLNSAPTVLRKGDIISVVGLAQVLDITANVDTTGTGGASLPINPPIFAGGSPADNALLTVTGVLLNAKLLELPAIPDAGPDHFIAGLQLTFREDV